MSGFDWRALLTAGRAAGLKPAEVWALTPAEFRVAIGESAGGRPMGRGTLDALRAAFPDNKGDEM